MKIYKATRISCPTFFIAGRDEKSQMNVSVALFISKKEATQWAALYPPRYQIEKTTVSVLKEKEIKNYLLRSDQTIDFTLELPGNLWSEFKTRREQIPLRVWDPENNKWTWATLPQSIKNTYNLN